MHKNRKKGPYCKQEKNTPAISTATVCFSGAWFFSKFRQMQRTYTDFKMRTTPANGPVYLFPAQHQSAIANVSRKKKREKSTRSGTFPYLLGKQSLRASNSCSICIHGSSCVHVSRGRLRFLRRLICTYASEEEGEAGKQASNPMVSEVRIYNDGG